MSAEYVDYEVENLPTSRAVVSPIDSLTDALQSERRLLDELISVMQRQRAAVGADDLQLVDDSVFSTHRVLVTLSEARRRRRQLNTLLGQREDLAVQSLDEVLGTRMTPALRGARDELTSAARNLSREVAINRAVLREALACGDAYARALAGAESVSPYKSPGAARSSTGRAQAYTLLDRRI